MKTILIMEYKDRARTDDGWRWYWNGITWTREDGRKVLFNEQVTVLSVA